MKKRFLSLALVLMMCLTLFHATALAADTVSQISIKIPACDAVFTLENVRAEYVIATSRYNDLPIYRFALLGTGGKVTCDLAAEIDVSYTRIDVKPENSEIQGGGYPAPAGWSESYPARWIEQDGGGLFEVFLTVRGDGTLEGYDKPAVAKIEFYFGYPQLTMGGQRPDDLISWEWKSTNTPGATAGGPDVIEQVNLPKHPVSGLAVSVQAESPSTWAVKEVSAAIEAGLVPENLQKNYTKSISRSEVAQMFINLIEKASGQNIDTFLAAKGVSINNNAFTDTTDKAVLAANALGIIKGVGDNRFDPNERLTRAQIAAIINRLASALDVDTSGYTHDFTDVAGHWADAELGWPVHTEIIQGVGNKRFDPEGPLTTEQAIAITYRALPRLK